MQLDRRDALLSLLGLGVGLEPLYSQQEQSLAASFPAATADTVAEPQPIFFNAEDFAAFAQLGEMLIPAYDGRPGAKETSAALFLDFLLSRSPKELQGQYRRGVARFRTMGPASLPAAFQASPDNPYLEFLNLAKVAFYRATLNSPVYAEAMQERSRSAAGMGSYWLPIPR